MVLFFNKGFISLLACQRIAAQAVPFGIYGKQAFGVLGVAADVRIFFKKNDFFAEFCALNGSREAGRTGADND